MTSPYAPEHWWPSREAWQRAAEQDVRALADLAGGRRVKVLLSTGELLTIAQVVDRERQRRQTDVAWAQEVSRRLHIQFQPENDGVVWHWHVENAVTVPSEVQSEPQSAETGSAVPPATPGPATAV